MSEYYGCHPQCYSRCSSPCTPRSRPSTPCSRPLTPCDSRPGSRPTTPCTPVCGRVIPSLQPCQPCPSVYFSCRPCPSKCPKPERLISSAFSLFPSATEIVKDVKAKKQNFTKSGRKSKIKKSSKNGGDGGVKEVPEQHKKVTKIPRKEDEGEGQEIKISDQTNDSDKALSTVIAGKLTESEEVGKEETHDKNDSLNSVNKEAVNSTEGDNSGKGDAIHKKGSICTPRVPATSTCTPRVKMLTCTPSTVTSPPFNPRLCSNCKRKREVGTPRNITMGNPVFKCRNIGGDQEQFKDVCSTCRKLKQTPEVVKRIPKEKCGTCGCGYLNASAVLQSNISAFPQILEGNSNKHVVSTSCRKHYAQCNRDPLTLGFQGRNHCSVSGGSKEFGKVENNRDSRAFTRGFPQMRSLDNCAQEFYMPERISLISNEIETSHISYNTMSNDTKQRKSSVIRNACSRISDMITLVTKDRQILSYHLSDFR